MVPDRDYNGTIPGPDQLDRARRRHAPYRARPLPRVGLADQSCRPELLTVRGAGTRPTALGHCRELGLLWACCGFALSGDWGGPRREAAKFLSFSF